MATPRHRLFRGVSLLARSVVPYQCPTNAPEMIWFRRHRFKGKHVQKQEHKLRTRLAHPKPVLLVPQEPLDRSDIKEAINKHGWIELP